MTHLEGMSWEIYATPKGRAGIVRCSPKFRKSAERRAKEMRKEENIEVEVIEDQPIQTAA